MRELLVGGRPVAFGLYSSPQNRALPLDASYAVDAPACSPPNCPSYCAGGMRSKKNCPSSFPFPPSPPSPPPPSCMITLLFLSLSIHIDHVRGEHAIQVHRICACHAEFTHQSIITRCFSVILLGFVLIVLIVIIVSSMTPIFVMRETATTHTYSFPSPSSCLPPRP